MGKEFHKHGKFIKKNLEIFSYATKFYVSSNYMYMSISDRTLEEPENFLGRGGEQRRALWGERWTLGEATLLPPNRPKWRPWALHMVQQLFHGTPYGGTLSWCAIWWNTLMARHMVEHSHGTPYGGTTLSWHALWWNTLMARHMAEHSYSTPYGRTLN